MKIYSYCLRKKDFSAQEYINLLKTHILISKSFVYDFKIGKSFQELKDVDVWLPNEDDYKMKGMQGHCVAIGGFSDEKYSGAFLILNSWGEKWGKNGKIWIKYSDFLHFGLTGEAHFYIFESVFNMLNEETLKQMKRIRKD